MKRNQAFRFLVAVPVLLLSATLLILYNQPGFTGNRVANPDSYMLEIQRMHGTDRHTMDLDAGDVLQIRFETEKGSLRLAITASDGTVLYTGDGNDVPVFTVNLPQSGAYSVTVAARHARGFIQIQQEKHR